MGQHEGEDKTPNCIEAVVEIDCGNDIERTFRRLLAEHQYEPQSDLRRKIIASVVSSTQVPKIVDVGAVGDRCKKPPRSGRYDRGASDAPEQKEEASHRQQSAGSSWNKAAGRHDLLKEDEERKTGNPQRVHNAADE